VHQCISSSLTRERANNRTCPKVSSKTKGGVHAEERTGREYTADEIKLLKTQDLNYLTAQLTTERKVSKHRCR
jgi:hypothetical protein